MLPLFALSLQVLYRMAVAALALIETTIDLKMASGVVFRGSCPQTCS